MNFRSSGVQPALIKTSVVGNVSKETGIRREGERKKKKHNTTKQKQTAQSPTQRRRGNSKIKRGGGGGTMGFPHQAFIIWDMKSYQPSPARTNTVAGGDSEPRGSGRAGEHSTLPTPLLWTRDPREKTSHTTALPRQKDQR